MMGLTARSLVILLIFATVVGAWCSEQEDKDLAPMEKTEQEALFSAIQGFVGNWWNGSELFPDPCGWTAIQGVSCDLFDGFWYVTSLNIGPIHDNSLTCNTSAKFSPQLFDLKHLKSLSLFNCFLSPHKHPVSIPTDNWWKLSDSLESLEFRLNPGLIGQIPSSFGSLGKLQSLVLVENGLTGELPTNVGGLVQLKRLVLAGNRFTGPIPDSFGALNHLLILDLSRNLFSGPLPISIGTFISLLKLDLSKNFLEGKLPTQLGHLKNLTLLDLRNNNFSGGLPSSLQEMCSLEEMALSNNPIGGDLKTLDWQNIQNLVVLDLSSTGLNGEIPESISKLERLRFLGLNDNKLTGDLFRDLEALPCLGALYLHGNNLTGELKFNGSFYHKMGSRFGAWNNPNLCYISALVQSHVPFGVKPCQQEVTLLDPNSKTSLDGGNLYQNFHFNASLGCSSFGIGGFWLLFGGFLQLMTVLLLY